MHALKTWSLVVVLSCSALGAEPVKTFAGWPLVVPGPAEKVTVADTTIAEAQLTKDGVKITGRKDGLTTVIIWRPQAAEAEAMVVQVEGAGWNLRPVLVSLLDLEEGTTVTVGMFEERPMPDAMLTSSVVKADSARFIAGQKLNVPVQKGDPLLWSAFETIKKK